MVSVTNVYGTTEPNLKLLIHTVASLQILRAQLNIAIIKIWWQVTEHNKT